MFENIHRIGIYIFAVSVLSFSQTKPNVILVMTDDQGYGDIAAHGNTIIQTPNMDALHNEAFRLTNFHVDPTCTPTRAALMSGTGSMTAQVWHTISARHMLRGEKITMAEVFEHNGYITSFYGKWHLGAAYPMRPMDQGFQHSLAHYGGIIGDAPDYWKNDYFDDSYFRNGVPEKFTGYCTDIWFDEAIKFIDTYKNDPKPFFIYLATNAPHLPYRVPQQYIDMYQNANWGGTPMNEIQNFYGMITRIDEKLGDLVQKLETDNLKDNTILIFMTDNGTVKPWFNDGMRGTKGSLWDGGHRVPFFIRWPNGNLQTQTSHDILSAHMDVLPTLIGLAGLTPPPGSDFEGIDLTPWINGSNNTYPNRHIVLEQQRLLHPQKYYSYAVLNQNYRLVTNRTGDPDLFDMRTDPGQRTPIQNSNATVYDAMKQVYEDYWTRMVPGHAGYPEMILGHDKGNPTTLTGEHWMVDDGMDINHIPWHQNDVYNGRNMLGWLPVKVFQDGHYNIGLSRWPEAAIREDNRINSGYSQLRVQIGTVDTTVQVNGNFGVFNIEMDLTKGSYKMRTWMKDSMSAYFVYVTRLSPNVSIGSSSETVSYSLTWDDIKSRLTDSKFKNNLNIYDTRGKLIFHHGKFLNGKSIHDMKPGLYFIKIKQGKNTHTYKVQVPL